MKNLVCLLLFMGLLCSSLAQNTLTNTAIDSLKRIVANPADKKQQLTACLILTKNLNFKNFDETQLYANIGIDIANEYKDYINTGILTRRKGLAHYFEGQYDTASFYYFKAIEILEKNNGKTELAETYNVTARLFRKLRKLPAAIEYYDKAMKIFTAENNTEGIATIYNESGVVYEYMGDYNEAINRYTLSLNMQRQRKDSLGMSYALNFIGGVYVLKNNFANAEKYNLEALHIRQRLNDSLPVALGYSDLGTVYLAWRKYDKAIASFTESNKIAAHAHYIELLAANLKSLSEVEKERKNYEAAFAYYSQHTALKDSIFNLEKNKQVEDISTKYQTAKKEQQITEQQLDITKRNYWIAAIATLLVFGSLLVFSFYKRYKLKQQATLQNEILKQQDLATKAVLNAEENERKRIAGELHDGVGQMMSAAKMNLSAMEGDIVFTNSQQKTAYEKVVALVDESCKEVRSVSHNMMPNALIKAGLASAVRDFIDKIDSRVIKVDLYTEGLNDRIDASAEAVLYRVIQESVNNTIKHAHANHLDISLIKDGDGIAVTIEDNGKGFDTTDTTKFDGIGLKNIMTRINFLKGEVEWNSAPGKGTIVAIHIPV